MVCCIKWNSLSLPAWQERFARIRRTNLLQSYDYARAICPLNRQKARWGLITINGEEAGLVQVLEASLCGTLLHAVMLDRGPLWFDGFGAPDHVESFFNTFHKEFPRRFGRKRRVIPEVREATGGPDLLTDLGYIRHPAPGYQTVWLDLTSDLETLRKNLKSQWRNKLNKAEKAGLEALWNSGSEDFSAVLRHYSQDRAIKGYDGPSVRLLQSLHKTFGRNLWIGRAVLKGEMIAAIILICHGTGATYQVGWTSEKGKQVAAHNLLLWQAVGRLKEAGVKDFDLGGINDESAQGVRDFKKGMGGTVVTLMGQYS
ncbi:MAG: GNAT family N-acetyltransferase [Alphaproteobacteria bacterium]|nr:GNAT family N-acetyltransferase [Alphaproteobacteria bacterium]